MHRRKKLIEHVPMLILLGLLAGALGGLGIGYVQLKAMSAASSNSK